MGTACPVRKQVYTISLLLWIFFFFNVKIKLA
jgi:hypothetical protein